MKRRVVPGIRSVTPPLAILIARRGNSRRPWGNMGAKYIPNIRDLKATKRFHQNLKPLPQAKTKQPVQATKATKTESAPAKPESAAK